MDKQCRILESQIDQVPQACVHRSERSALTANEDCSHTTEQLRRIYDLLNAILKQGSERNSRIDLCCDLIGSLKQDKKDLDSRVQECFQSNVSEAHKSLDESLSRKLAELHSSFQDSVARLDAKVSQQLNDNLILVRSSIKEERSQQEHGIKADGQQLAVASKVTEELQNTLARASRSISSVEGMCTKMTALSDKQTYLNALQDVLSESASRQNHLLQSMADNIASVVAEKFEAEFDRKLLEERNLEARRSRLESECAKLELMVRENQRKNEDWIIKLSELENRLWDLKRVNQVESEVAKQLARTPSHKVRMSLFSGMSLLLF